MNILKRFTAILLCMIMILPTQELIVLADPTSMESVQIEELTPPENMEHGEEDLEEALPSELMEDGEERIEETLPLEPIETLVERIEETLPLESLDEDVYAIYWNPGGQLPAELASASNAKATASHATASHATASKATASRSKAGRDTANGLSPERPVKTLAKAVKRAEELMKKKGVDSSDITIYAMNPMEVADGELYVLNAANMRIA